MQRFAWCFVLSIAPGLSCAAELSRCVAADGAVSYQDTPCEAGSRLTKTIAVPEIAPAQAQVAKSKPAKAGKGSAQKSALGGAKPAKGDKRNRQRQACAAARAEEERVLAGLGLERTFEQLRALGDKVHAACKGL
ncbi:DUF4124 domain-containing protein [Lysobacter sp. 2RAF19]